MYRRTSNTGHVSEWNPEDESAAGEAMTTVLPDVDPSEYPVDVDAETAREIHEEYDRIESGKSDSGGS